jgi:hypothetical protein
MNEQRLWIACLVQGLTDACNKFLWQNRLNSKYYQEALDWVGGKDFKLVCSFAGLEPEDVIQAYNNINKHKHYLTVEDIRYLLNETFSRRSVL